MKHTFSALPSFSLSLFSCVLLLLPAALSPSKHFTLSLSLSRPPSLFSTRWFSPFFFVCSPSRWIPVLACTRMFLCSLQGSSHALCHIVRAFGAPLSPCKSVITACGEPPRRGSFLLLSLVFASSVVEERDETRLKDLSSCRSRFVNPPGTRDFLSPTGKPRREHAAILF